jgi:hypothetical protein
MGSKEDQKRNPVARLRERFFEKKKNRVPSEELKDTFKKKAPPTQEEESRKKIAQCSVTPKPRKEIDL